MNTGLCYFPFNCNEWKGYIDQLSVFHRAKGASEVLENVILVAYYSFDHPAFPQLDSGPLRINGTVAVNVSSGVPGRINQSLLFPGAPSFTFHPIPEDSVGVVSITLLLSITTFLCSYRLAIIMGL